MTFRAGFLILAAAKFFLSLAKTLGVLSFTPLTMLQACAQAVDFKVGHHFGEGQPLRTRRCAPERSPGRRPSP